MGKFPSRQVEVVALAESVVQGLTGNPAVFPNPPVPPAVMMVDLLAVVQAHDEAVAAMAAADQKIEAKNEKLAVLVKKMKDNLRYAENTVDYDDDFLKLLGWSGRAKRKPLVKPGQCGNFRATAEGSNWIELAWEAPTDGGKPAMYRILRRENGTFKWTVAETSFETAFRLKDQENGKKMDYCVVASNKAGESGESNIVTAVL